MGFNQRLPERLSEKSAPDEQSGVGWREYELSEEHIH